MLTTLRQFQTDSFCFRGASEIWGISESAWIQIVSEPVNKYLTNLVFSVRTVSSYGSSIFPFRFMARALCVWAINRREKDSVRNLQYGPRTRLVRGIYLRTFSVFTWLHMNTKESGEFEKAIQTRGPVENFLKLSRILSSSQMIR